MKKRKTEVRGSGFITTGLLDEFDVGFSKTTTEINMNVQPVLLQVKWELN